ncbi:MAG TPA: hypothetical protein VGJ63_06250 [Micromonosporaceae bacterium]|jgi:FtsZ-interacting cell division protein ZipA
MSSGAIVITIIVVVLLALLALGLWYTLRRRELRKRFGPEYDRVVAEKDNRRDAERELRDRERQHRELELRPLSEESHARYAAGWADIQAKFVDDPTAAVDDADKLVGQLVAERGYPTDDYEEQLAHLSVEHARTLGHYRDAHDINLRNQRGEASTEQLRQALVHYRALFGDLLGDEQVGRPDGQPSSEPLAEPSPAPAPAPEQSATPTTTEETPR